MRKSKLCDWRVPLKRDTSLESHPVLVPVEVRRALAARSGAVCEIGRDGCLGAARDVHHRVLRGNGGRHGSARETSDRLSNLLHLCRVCHEWVHAHVAAAREAGWLLDGREVPPQVALAYRGEPRYLADDGRVAPFEAVGA
jgi:hypothetical protein